MKRLSLLKVKAESLVTVLIVSVLFFFYSQIALATQPQKPKKEIKIGVYIMQLYDLNLADKSFNVIFWLWSRGSNEMFDLKNDLDIINAEKVTTDLYHFGKTASGQPWESIKYSATIIKDWDLSLFPFDRELLQIDLESAVLKLSEIQFIPDIDNSGIDPEVGSDDWEIVKFELIPMIKVYQSSFEPSDVFSESKFTRLIAQVTVERKGLRKFIQYLGVTYLAGILGLCIYLIPVKKLEPRISLLSGAIFAAVGNKIMLDSALPTVSTLTLVDKAEIIIFISLCVALFITILTSWINKEQEVRAERLNRYGFIFSLIFLALANVYIFLPLWF